MQPLRRHRPIVELGAKLLQLVARGRRRITGGEHDSARIAVLAMAKSVGWLALGLPSEREILRLPNGDWEEITQFGGEALPVWKMDDPVSGLENCDQIFLETITEGDVRSQLEELVASLGVGDVTTLPPEAVARGALVAGERMRDGDPVYFDFLPRISTIVVGNGVAQNFDLIDESETLEAGRVYRSLRPAKLAIPKGFDEISIHLRKDAAPHPRKAVITLNAAQEIETPVSVWVEQKPAAGRARIIMEAPSLARSFAVDWEKAEEDPREWDQIIAAFDTPPPPVPDRLILKCGLNPWRDSPRAPGMFTLLDETERNETVDWRPLAEKAMARPYQEYCVSSDGELPTGIPEDARRQLDTVTRAAVAVNRSRLEAPEKTLRDNAALQFLTWQFRRCPAEVSEWLVTCIEEQSGQVGTHPFIWHPSNWVLIYQGIARTAQNDAIEARVLRAVLRHKAGSWNYRAESACISIMLSRSTTAPLLLTRDDVEEIGRRAILEFQHAYGSQYTRFNYAPFLVGGIIRWRLKEPRALLTGHDPLADRLEEVIVRARNDLRKRRGDTQN